MFKAPTLIPAFSTLVDDLVTRDFKKIARHLGITPDTLKKWYQSDSAPRMAYLAIFWETRWGLSIIDCHITNRDRLRLGLIDALKCENKTLKLQIAELTKPKESLRAANDAVFAKSVINFKERAEPARSPVSLHRP